MKIFSILIFCVISFSLPLKGCTWFFCCLGITKEQDSNEFESPALLNNEDRDAQLQLRWARLIMKNKKNRWHKETIINWAEESYKQCPIVRQ